MRRDQACLPLAGGTDVMVELNFDRRRPEAILDLTGVAELRESARVGDDAAHRRGRDLRRSSCATTRRRCPASRSRRARSARRRSATGARSAATSGPPRRPATCLPPLLAAGAEVELRSADAGTRRVPASEFFIGPKRSVLQPGRADHRRPRAGGAGAAAVRQGRHAQRDGDRRVLVRDRARPGRRDASAPASARPGRRRCGRPRPSASSRARSTRRRLGRRRWPARRRASRASASSSRPRRRRSTTCAAAPPTAATRSPCSRGGRCAGRLPVWSGRVLLSTTVNGEVMVGRRRLGGREPALRAARAARPAGLQERVRAGRVRLVLGLPRRRARVRLPRARRRRPRAARS